MIDSGFRFYHFGCDKPDIVDEVGQPILDDCAETSLLPDDEQQLEDYTRDMFRERKGKREHDISPPSASDLEKFKEPEQPDEGTKASVAKDTLPQILPAKEVQEDRAVVSLKRSDSALNIFDQTTILKLFSATNWTETFFNRIFRKKFLVISHGDEKVIKLKNGFAFEQPMMHVSHKFPEHRTRDLLPAIASERDMKLTNGLLSFSLPSSIACWTLHPYSS